MTSEEAELPKIAPEERRHYLRVLRDKTNLAPPGKATWIRLVSVELPDATAPSQAIRFRLRFVGLPAAVRQRDD